MGSKKLVYILLLLFVFLTGCDKKMYTITFDTLGGSVVESIVINEGGVIKNINAPVKDGYLFVSWLKDGLEYDFSEPVNENVTLTANWIEAPMIYDYYTVTFIMNDKTEKIVVKENETVDELTAPELENYLFLGWFTGEEKFDFNSKITKDISLIAKYELNVVTVTYDLDGGYGLAIETIPKYTSVTIPEIPVKKGYKFLKWTLNGQEFSFDTKISEDITLTANWSLIEYVTISFDTDGGDLIDNQSIEKYSKLDKLPIPYKNGYVFKEWRLNDEVFNLDTSIEDNITLKAFYEIKLDD